MTSSRLGRKPSLTNEPQLSQDPLGDKQFVEGRDFYVEDGKYVFTQGYLRERGYCCGNGCRHCPYEPEVQQREKDKKV